MYRSEKQMRFLEKWVMEGAGDAHKPSVEQSDATLFLQLLHPDSQDLHPGKFAAALAIQRASAARPTNAHTVVC